MTKQATRYIFEKIKDALLHSGYEVVLSAKMVVAKGEYVRFREAKGYIAPDELRIYINKNIGINDRVITLVHELLHELYPSWRELRVENQSKQIFKHLTVSQLGFLQFFVMTKSEIDAALKRHQAHSPLC
ncbi:MAG: hypothetical protein PHR51_01450 [Patescibacteria group bacterium]|nr:hypothetical protein [Patescibacteria group bacterium]